MDREKIAQELLKMAKKLIARGKYVDVSSLPLGIQKALKGMKFGRKNIQVIGSPNYSASGAGDGNRAVSVTVNLRSGRITDQQTGSWGGSNMFVDTPIDRNDQTKVPNNSAVIVGEMGGRGNFLRIYANPSDINLLISISDEEEVTLTDDESKALNVIGGTKSGYRADEFHRKRLGPYSKSNPTIIGLADKGMIQVMQNGIKITTKGRNFRD